MYNSTNSGPETTSTTRRRLLGGLAVAGIPLLSGCAQVTDNAFVAAPVYITPEDADAAGYRELVRDEHTATEHGRAYGLDVNTTLTSRYAVYGEIGGEDGDAPGLTVGALSTPKARVLSEVRNPLATLRAQQLLTEEGALWFREPVGLGGVDRTWKPTRLLGERTEILGEDVWFTVRAGLVDVDADPSVLSVYYANLELDGDVVFLVAVRQWAVDATDRPFVGEDGYLTEDELAADVESVTEAFNLFGRG